MTQLDNDQVRNAWEEGLSVEEIALAFEVPEARVRGALTRLGYSPPPPPPAPSQARRTQEYDEDQERDAVHYLRHLGRGEHAIANIRGLTLAVVKKLLKAGPTQG
ncbi:MAG: hypothetical protein ACI80V_000244 [Rhodothermales bacterium]|jgi:hypothetical protein